MPPYWYRIVKAAEYYGVGPWELATRPFHWVEYAESARQVEAEAEAERERRASKRKGLT